MGFVFEPNLDACRGLRRERLEVLAVIVVAFQPHDFGG